MYCPKCGQQIPDGAAFCNVCGSPIGQARRPDQYPESPIYGEKQKPAYYDPNYKAPKKKRSKAVLVLVALVLLGVVVAAVGSSSKGSSDKAGNTPSPGSAEAAAPTLSPEEEKQAFIDSCVEVAYKDLMRYPDQYEGEHVVITLHVSQVMSGGEYRCYDKGGILNGDEYVLRDKREDDDTKILEGDKLLVYGTFYGLESFRRALAGTKVEVPRIDGIYIDINPESQPLTAGPGKNHDIEG